jgi:hypothetical protein
MGDGGAVVAGNGGVDSNIPHQHSDGKQGRGKPGAFEIQRSKFNVEGWTLKVFFYSFEMHLREAGLPQGGHG